MASNEQQAAVPKPKGLLERLRDKEAVICAEGYILSFERRGYLQAGPFVPEVVLGRPDLVRLQYEEFVHAGSDVVVALTYYTNRARLKLIGREDQLELINRYALRLAKGVAVQTGTLMAGNICDTSLFIPNNFDSKEAVKAIFREQVGWAVQEGADFVIGETFGHVGEAILATEVIKEAGLPAVVTLRVTNQFFVDGKLATFDGIELGQALQMLQNAGADVVGFNCSTGPRTMISLLAQYRQNVQVPFAALPVGYRTNEKEVTYQDLTDPLSGQKVYPGNLDCIQCSRDEIAEFGRQCARFGVQYLGICCGNNAGFTRALSESIGRIPPASRFRPDMSKYVSDLHRRLMYLQKLKEMASDQAEQPVSNGIEQKDTEDQEEPNIERKDNHQMTKQAQDQEEQDMTSNIQQHNEEETTDVVETDVVETKETDVVNIKETDVVETKETDVVETKENDEGAPNGQSVPESSVDTLSIRLPPPPGHGFKRNDSKRNRTSPSPTMESNGIRLPPPPGHGVKRNDSRRRRASSSSSNDSNAISNGADIRLPPPPGHSFQRTGSGRSRGEAHSPSPTSHIQASEENGVKGESQENDNVNSSNTIVRLPPSPSDNQSPSLLPSSPEEKTISLTKEQFPEEKRHQKDPDVKTEEDASIESTTEESDVAIQKDTLVDVSVQETELQETVNEFERLPVNVSTNRLGEEQGNEEGNEWTNLSASKSEGKSDDSPSSSGDEEQMGYTRLEKEDDGFDSPSWANFPSSTNGQNHGHGQMPESKTETKETSDSAEFMANKSEEIPPASNQCVDFSTIQDTGGTIEILTESNSAQKLESEDVSLDVVETSVADSPKPQEALSIGLDEDYDDSEA